MFLKSLEHFGTTEVFLVESDSSDSTVKILEKLKTYKKIDYVSFGDLRNQIPNRIDRIRYCRNKYVEKIRSDSTQYDYIVVADLDGVNKCVSWKTFSSIFKDSRDWSMCGANQKFGYYDIYALRADNWCETDYQTELQLQLQQEKLNYLKRDSIRRRIIYTRMRKISKKSEWINVQSAFGGLAIYKSEVFNKFDYSATNSELSLECEHVTLHRKMHEDGMKMYICPSMINAFFNEYNVNRFAIVRFSKYVRKKYLKKGNT
jgi:hypothetical protein